MVCPVGDALDQHLMVYDKSPTGDSVRERAATAVRYVPLIDEKSQRNGVPGLF